MSLEAQSTHNQNSTVAFKAGIFLGIIGIAETACETLQQQRALSHADHISYLTPADQIDARTAAADSGTLRIFTGEGTIFLSLVSLAAATKIGTDKKSPTKSQ